jgi:putative selenium metabolism hydrolase
MDIDRLVDFARDLVRIRSLSGEEGPAAERVSREMRQLGFDDVSVDSIGNTIGVIEGQETGPTMLLDAHVDTVGIAPGTEWQRDPFGGDVEGGYLHGRGSADMKGALAAMVHGAADVDRRSLHGRLVVSASVMEEVMEGCALREVMDALHPQYVVIGEATDLNLNLGGRGRAEIHVETHGRPAHSSSPSFGHNAVYDMVRVIGAIQSITFREDPLLGPALIELTDIISDPYPGHSVIPSRCRATFDRRLLTDETLDDVIRQIADLPGLGDVDFDVSIPTGEFETFSGERIRGKKVFPAWSFDDDHPFVRSALQGLQSAGLDPALGAYRFCTNAAHSAGTAGVPTVGFGPGREEDAHVVDERLSLKDLERAAGGYRGIVMAVLGSG